MLKAREKMQRELDEKALQAEKLKEEVNHYCVCCVVCEWCGCVPYTCRKGQRREMNGSSSGRSLKLFQLQKEKPHG